MPEIKIEEAFCIQRARIMSIDEVREDFFANGKELYFLCPDDACRESHEPRMSAVNYKAETFLRPPHFRRIHNHIHSPECFLGHYEEALREALKDKNKYREGGRNIFQEGDTVDHQDVPDEFLISHDDTNRSIISNMLSTKKEQLKTKYDYISYAVQNKKKTKSLEMLAFLHRKMSIKDKKTFHLTINGVKRTYFDAFKLIGYLKQDNDDPFIYFGKAKVYAYTKHGFTIFFKKKVQQYRNVDNNPLTATILIEYTTKEYYPRLHDKLLILANNKQSFDCYVFGQGIHIPCCAEPDDREKYCRSPKECVTFLFNKDNMKRIAILSEEQKM
jgi:hypothetical protein